MITTTIANVVEKLRTTIEGLTPGSMSDQRFERISVNQRLREAALVTGTAMLRHFEIERTGPREDNTVLDPAACLITRQVTVTIAYPVDAAMYGERYLLDLEDIADADAQQIRDALFSPANLESGAHQGNITTVQPLDKSLGTCWFQAVDARVIFFTSQSL